MHTQTAFANSLDTLSNVKTIIEHTISHLVRTQVGSKVCNKLWGQQCMEVIMKKMEQFYNHNVVRPF